MRKNQSDPEYKRLYYDYLTATLIITSLSASQRETKEKLKIEMLSDPIDIDKVKQLRKQLKQNRKGKDGLRSLNKRINYYYNYCARNHIPW